MTAQFTPGPWNEDGPIIYTGINQRTGKIAEVSLAYKDSATYSANVHLIAAAPELYETDEYAAIVLREMAAILRGVGMSGCADICEAAATKSEAALVKARGEQSS